MTFPNIKEKYLYDSIISPKDYIRYLKKRKRFLKTAKPPKGIIICFQKSLINFITKNFRVTKIEGSNSEFYFLNETNNTIGICGNVGIGAPSVIAVMEELAAFGIKNFISIGSAGGLQKNLKAGDIIVCSKAIRDEGTSYHYLKPSKYTYASTQIRKGIESNLNRTKTKYSIGTSWTTDSPYRETINEIREYQKEGVLTVEMEASALFALGKYREVNIASLFVISDLVLVDGWKPKMHYKNIKKGLETLFYISLDTLLEISR